MDSDLGFGASRPDWICRPILFSYKTFVRWYFNSTGWKLLWLQQPFWIILLKCTLSDWEIHFGARSVCWRLFRLFRKILQHLRDTSTQSLVSAVCKKTMERITTSRTTLDIYKLPLCVFLCCFRSVWAGCSSQDLIVPKPKWVKRLQEARCWEDSARRPAACFSPRLKQLLTLIFFLHSAFLSVF